MAKLKLIEKQESEDVEFLPSAGTVPQENPEFIEFRTQYYYYQYQFISRAKNTEVISERLALYKSLATSDCDMSIYGMSTSNDTYMRNFKVVLTIDFKLSPQKSLKVFDKSCADLRKQIKSMYNVYKPHEAEYITDFPKNASGKVRVDANLFQRWKNALEVYDKYENQTVKNKKEISDEMDWFDKHKDPHHATEEISGYIKYAKKLIEAASKGKLFEEASKPMTADKKRTIKG